MNFNNMGIMVSDLNTALSTSDQNFYKRLCIFGLKLKIIVFIFALNQIKWEQNQLTGVIYKKKTNQWIPKTFPIPTLIYDRCFIKSREQFLLYRKQLSMLKNIKEVQFLGNRLMDKWSVYHVLKSDSLIKNVLPETELYKNTGTLNQWLKHQNQFILKPISGSHGKGILHIKKNNHYIIQGRDKKNVPIDVTYENYASLANRIQQFIQNRKYIIQQYLHLKTKSNTSFDIRALVQKNGSGQWQFTGMAVRCGQPGSLTSNLHGGGFVKEVRPFLINEFGETKAVDIMNSIQEIVEQLPTVLEAHSGRLSELGIDLGVDSLAKVWLLEANSKPGRSIFNHLKDENLKNTSIQLPIYYANYLLYRQLGG
ncbi:YheC/YheD family protein [Chengkuizengella sediminis]|uniref:YheC/YheD family endospore coat-associated protein n=1 Tax=Chengkuizengella sediminis TaxID=1885917 RepID=UPI00138A0C1E|nr:YheC/YheD family protein [Chengkuizengella sediminis]NDI36301.1 YheC/YheD family protein [Chengkuizengella sediminis]